MSSQSIQRKIEALTAQMLRAAEAEDFESAARLRNEIEQLRGPRGGAHPASRTR
jgi:protein-arginine kinase activator protein McsA